MQSIQLLLSSAALDRQPFPGLSWAFILIFYGPLLAVALAFFVYSLLARRSVIPVAKALLGLWLAACVPAGSMMLMGYAFNSRTTNPLVSIPLWVGIGAALLWAPVWYRRLFGYRPA